MELNIGKGGVGMKKKDAQIESLEWERKDREICEKRVTWAFITCSKYKPVLYLLQVYHQLIMLSLFVYYDLYEWSLRQ